MRPVDPNSSRTSWSRLVGGTHKKDRREGSAPDGRLLAERAAASTCELKLREDHG